MSFPTTAAAKAALETYVRALAFELAPEGVTVNAVAPGFIQKDAGTPAAATPELRAKVTAGIPMGRMGSADEVAAVLAFLLSRDAGSVQRSAERRVRNECAGTRRASWAAHHK